MFFDSSPSTLLVYQPYEKFIFQRNILQGRIEDQHLVSRKRGLMMDNLRRIALSIAAVPCPSTQEFVSRFGGPSQWSPMLSQMVQPSPPCQSDSVPFFCHYQMGMILVIRQVPGTPGGWERHTLSVSTIRWTFCSAKRVMVSRLVVEHKPRKQLLRGTR